MKMRKSKVTREQVKVCAGQCVSRKEFRQKFSRAYGHAYRNEYLNEVCAHMPPLGNRLLRYVYAIELENEAYIGLSMNPEKRFLNHTIRGTKDVRRIISKGAKLIKLTGLISVEDAVKLEGLYLEEYQGRGYRVLNRKKTGGIGGATLFWTEENIIEEARKYTSRKNFITSSHGAYAAAVKAGILDRACAHMKRLRKKLTDEQILDAVGNFKNLFELRSIRPDLYDIGRRRKKLTDVPRSRHRWTDEELADEALKYKSRSEFAKNSRAYAIAKIRKLLDVVCTHMSSRLSAPTTDE